MSTIKCYDDCKIRVIQKTNDPGWVCKMASDMTQRKDHISYKSPEKEKQMIKYLLEANHTSIFEHCYITVIIVNVSRSFLAQITRHRIGSFTSASQHYQEYSGYPNVLSPGMIKDSIVKELLSFVDQVYNRLICEGVPKEEARQILPNAKAVTIMWTVNARSLVNFLNLRMCKRNVSEMLLFAHKMSSIAKAWWPSLFDLVGPDCFMTECTQGRMACSEKENT